MSSTWWVANTETLGKFFRHGQANLLTPELDATLVLCPIQGAGVNFKGLNSLGPGYLQYCLLPCEASWQLRQLSDNFLKVLLLSEVGRIPTTERAFLMKAITFWSFLPRKVYVELSPSSFELQATFTPFFQATFWI